uniref:Uncharacterized protein n=1 Tax=Tetradesmus obliquus TaxID=3088 RepID=A0A383VJC1_TETOB|eukprot:jgi/Sobl393_1/10313/SZX64929.1
MADLKQGSASHQHEAAAVIQKHFRRYQAQKRYKQQQSATSTIQQHASRFLARRQAARDNEQEQRAARFQAVMSRHHERIQQLELEKRAIKQLGAGELEAWQARREAAATTIQAHWRGSRQRQQLKLSHPALATLRPVACSSPQPADEPSCSTRPISSKVPSNHPLLHSVTAAGVTGLHAEPSTASVAAWPAHRAGLEQQPSSASVCSGVGYSSRAAAMHGALRGEASSCLSAEASRLSAVGAAAQQPADAPRRTAALPAARRMVLERQVQLRTDAFKAAPNALAAARATQQESDQRLVHLLEQHTAAAAERLKAAQRRQKLLQDAEALHSQLQQLPQLSQLPDNVTGAHFALPGACGARAQRSRQAHALALAEAKVGSKWWLPLKALNQQLRDAAAAAEQDAGSTSGSASKAAAGALWGAAGSTGLLQQDWQQQELMWKDSWQRIREEEQQRPGLQELMQQDQALRPHVVIEQELSSESSWHAASMQ